PKALPRRLAEHTGGPSEDQLALHEADREPPGHEREPDEEREVPDVGPAVEAEDRVANELHAVEQRVEVAEHLRPLRQPAQREERAGDEEHRREQPALPVREALDRLRPRGDEEPEARPAAARERR